ncbi:MAG TPA: hypothetical protein VKV15_28435 [Bryobacteraceae bacterium]|nr:hypothetical protein [Bryobacteraceae bacterium]
MRNFFTSKTPPFTRVVLIESGSRELIEGFLPGFYERFGEQLRVDLVTCYGGVPRGFREDRGQVYRVSDYQGSAARQNLYKELAANGYKIGGILCSAEPIMTKWKWALALKLPVKILVINENLDYFWLDWAHRKIILHFILFRAGMTGAGAVSTLARLAAFPFTLLYLLLYAAAQHLKRAVRLALK